MNLIVPSLRISALFGGRKTVPSQSTFFAVPGSLFSCFSTWQGSNGNGTNMAHESYVVVIDPFLSQVGFRLISLTIVRFRSSSHFLMKSSFSILLVQTTNLKQSHILSV